MPCKKCGLQYSSYCIDCIYVKTGLNLNDEVAILDTLKMLGTIEQEKEE